ncbi:MAG: glycosyltransferase [Bacteroidia bacterium]|nr:glycosyltransferase [Bacteroidia bacterium]NNK70499.1 glycosyltransferase [Flavobacteriaceae bacterium]NNL79308.1 glycosyltransferase [Flavobacteriaceae bacterium]
MQNKNKKKICLIVSSLGKGGAERSAGLLSKTLHLSGHDISIVTILNRIEYDFEGRIFNLGELKEKNDSIFGKISRFLKFRAFLSKEKFDYIIDSRTRVSAKRQNLVRKFLFRSTPVIYMVRSSELVHYLGRDKNKTQAVYSLAYKIVAVTNSIAKRIKAEYGLDNVICIHNAVDLSMAPTEENIESKGDFILFYGRLNDSIKNIKGLIDAYSKSKLPAQNINFVIMGDGPDEDSLKNYAESTVCSEKISFLPHRADPFGIVKQARFTVLGSRFEGLPRSIIESLSLGVPVISSEYIGDPREILKQGENGLIVESDDTDAFASAMNSFIFDKELYERCCSNARQSISHLSLERIAEEWDKILL